MGKIRILICDDHKIIRDGILAMLEDMKNIEVVAEANSGHQAVDHCRSKEVDLVIMDITMPEMDGIEATRIIKEEFPNIEVLALTMMKEDEHIRQMVAAGASGYISKSSGMEELADAIEIIMKGDHYFGQEAVDTIMQDLVKSSGKKKTSSATEALTEREQEILEHICMELTNQEIADKLFISVRTVDAHRRNLLKKTGARNTAGLVKYAINNKLIS